MTNDGVIKVKPVFHLSDFSSTNVDINQASLIAVESMNSKQLYDGLEKLNYGVLFEAVFMN